MSSDKRSFSDFENFPGKLSQSGYAKGWYVFPAVKSLDSMSRTRTWRIYVRLIKTDDGKEPERRTTNWDTKLDTVVPIKPVHLKNNKKDIPANTIAQIWTINSIEPKKQPSGVNPYKSTRSVPTYILTGKNIGKKNETTVFTQALINARSKYLKKLQSAAINVHKDRFFPVAVHKYDEKPKDELKHIRYPAIVQRKLDGGRAVAYWDSDKKKAVMYTRKLKNIDGVKHIYDALDILFPQINKKYKGVYFDGEIYKHGLSLQDITGHMRRDTDSKTTTREERENKEIPALEYHIFDVFFPKGSNDMKNLPLLERKIIVDNIFNINTSKVLKKVKSHIARNEQRETELYNQFLEEKYEGSIVKNMNAPYEFGIGREIRTYQMRKRKPRYSDEYKLVGYTEGEQGKDKGAILWILETEGSTDHPAKQFTAAPVGIDYEERYRIFREMTLEKFNNKYKGKMMTIEYDDISVDKVPLRAKAKCIRIFD